MGISRQNYVIARVRKSELKKIRAWLDNKDHIELSTHDNPSQVYIFNRTKTDGF